MFQNSVSKPDYEWKRRRQNDPAGTSKEDMPTIQKPPNEEVGACLVGWDHTEGYGSGLNSEAS